MARRKAPLLIPFEQLAPALRQRVRAVRSGWVEWLDRFAPACADPEGLRQRRVTVAVCLCAGTGMLLGTALSAWPPPHPGVRGASLALGATLLLVPALMRHGARFGVLRHVPPAALALWLALVIAVTGGEDVGAFFVAITMPALAVSTSGARPGALWSGVVCATLVGVGWLGPASGRLPPGVQIGSGLQFDFFGAAIGNLVVLGALLAHEGLRTRAMSELSESRRRESEAERLRLESVSRFSDRLQDLVVRRTLELERSQEQLRRSERLASLGTLAAGLAHEMNNPLAVIRAAAEYARACAGDADGGELAQQALRDIEVQAERCGRIVRGVLRFSGESGGEAREGRAREVVAAAREACLPFAAERCAQIEVEAAGGPDEVLMQSTEVEQALVEILRNAVESRSRGARVHVRIDGDDAWVRIRVRDDGEGIGPEDLPRVCDPFYTTRQQDGRRGLGLAAAHGIASAHGGRLLIASQPGRGTRVSLELPRHRPRAAASAR